MEAAEAVRAVALVSGRGGLRGFMTVVVPDDDDGGLDSPYAGPLLVVPADYEPVTEDESGASGRRQVVASPPSTSAPSLAECAS